MTTLIDLNPPEPCATHSRFEIERLLAEDLPREDASELRQHLEQCAACQTTFASLQAEREAFFVQQPLARFVEDHRLRRQRQHPWKEFFASAKARQTLLGGLGVLGAMAALVLWFAPSQSGLRSKGGGQKNIAFLIKEGDSVRRGRDGEQLHQGDQIQFLVRAPQRSRSMVLLGLDGQGAVTVYRAELVHEQSKGETHLQPLNASLILDQALGVERFFLVFSQNEDLTSLEVEARRAAQALREHNSDLRQVTQLELDAAGLIQDSIAIVKVSP